MQRDPSSAGPRALAKTREIERRSRRKAVVIILYSTAQNRRPQSLVDPIPVKRSSQSKIMDASLSSLNSRVDRPLTATCLHIGARGVPERENPDRHRSAPGINACTDNLANHVASERGSQDAESVLASETVYFRHVQKPKYVLAGRHKR
jgi:hypothetical protein